MSFLQYGSLLDQKLCCSKRKTALQQSKKLRCKKVALSCRFPAAFKPPRLGSDLLNQNRTIAIASDFRVDGAKSPAIPQKAGVLSSEIAVRNRKSLATFHRTLKSQRGIAFSCLGNRAISGVRDGHRNRRSQKSLRFRCAIRWGTRKASIIRCKMISD